jgi:Ca-activated chloride channel family protein
MLTIPLLFPVPALADGIVIPDPPICEDGPCFPPDRPIPIDQLVIRYHQVEVEIDDQIAITRVDQVFYNPNDWVVEGTYIFPLPPGAAVSGFTLWVDGQPVEGEVLDADEARRTYEGIVREMRDPALLEYIDQGAVRARIFPIPPGGERRVELEYTQTLAAENGLVGYRYPLNTEKFSTQPLERVSIHVDVRSSVPIRAMYSPSHPVAQDRLDENHIAVGYEDTRIRPDADFVLYYSLGEEQAFHLLSYRDPGDPADPDGFFALLLAPRPDVDVRGVPKDVLLVLDRSGSMDGEKFHQAQEALRYILGHLNPEDRFNVVTFSTGVELYQRRMRPAAEAAEATAWVDRLSTVGSTDINRALLEATALVDPERPTYLIFLTDGLPTEGVKDSQAILDNLASVAPKTLRLFAFGVGYDVDTFLLDSLAEAHHGTSTYVTPGERLDEILSAFYAKVSTPVLTDLGLDFGDLAVYDLYPHPLPDLFAGSQIVAIGRYRSGGRTTVTLTGDVNGALQTFQYPEQVFVRDSTGVEDQWLSHALPRLWATRKIGHLLNQVRLRGPDPETVEQIVRLSIRYGIVTPYTSYLVTEPMPLGAVEQERIAAEQLDAMEAAPQEPAYGATAVEKAAEQGALAGADQAAGPSGESADVVRVVGSRTYVLSEGVWVDTAYDPDLMDTVPVAFLSDNYFALASAHAELGDAFALGEEVIAFADGVAYRVVAAETPVDPLDLPEAESTVTPEVGPTAQPAVTPISDQNPAANPAVPCVGGLLPVVIVPLGALLSRARRER